MHHLLAALVALVFAVGCLCQVGGAGAHAGGHGDLVSLEDEWELTVRAVETVYGHLAQLKQSTAVPEQVHLAFGSSATTMTVSWVTFHNSSDGLVGLVQYGTSATNLDETVAGVTTTYDCGILGGWHGWIHTATLSGLANGGAAFFYRVGDGTTWSDVFPSASAPALGADVPVRFAIAGDMGTVIPAGFRVANLMATNAVDAPLTFVQIVGDLAYAGTGRVLEYEPIWDDYLRQMQPGLAESVPLMVGAAARTFGEFFSKCSAGSPHTWRAPFMNVTDNGG